MNWETYIAFGDSITLGARTYLSYPEKVGHALSGQLLNQWDVVNHSVCGFKAIDLARDIDRHFLSLKEKKPSIVSILIGTNDIKAHTTLDDFGIALNQIILKAKLLTTHENVIILAIPLFHRGITYPYSFGMNDTISAYNCVIKNLSTQHSVRMLELNHTENDFVDGVHLNANGIATFSSQIARYILKDKGIDAD